MNDSLGGMHRFDGESERLRPTLADNTDRDGERESVSQALGDLLDQSIAESLA